jgi:hypothetical protein
MQLVMAWPANSGFKVGAAYTLHHQLAGHAAGHGPTQHLRMLHRWGLCPGTFPRAHEIVLVVHVE